MSGFDSSSIDYERLLRSISFKSFNGEYTLCYSKSALSVVENVVYAHDLEKKWIQSHPTVLYEAYLVKKVFEEVIIQQFPEYNCLPEELLSSKGLKIGCGKIRLASDSDMFFMMKNLRRKSLVDEYFDRRKRRHPIWKTEAEYQAIFEGQKETIKGLKDALNELNMGQKTGGIELNTTIYKGVENEIKQIEQFINSSREEVKRTQYEKSLIKKNQQKELLEIFKSFSESNNMKFDYLVLYTDQFNSSFKKVEFSDMKFDLPMVGGLKNLKDISNVLRTTDSKDDEYFYIYYRKNGNDGIIDFAKLIQDLMKYLGNLQSQKNAEIVSKRIR